MTVGALGTTEKSVTLSVLLRRMEGGATRTVDGARGSEAPQDGVDVGVGEGLTWIHTCLRAHGCQMLGLPRQSRGPGGRCVLQQPPSARAPGHCAAAPGGQVIWR